MVPNQLLSLRLSHSQASSFTSVQYVRGAVREVGRATCDGDRAGTNSGQAVGMLRGLAKRKQAIGSVTGYEKWDPF